MTKLTNKSVLAMITKAKLAGAKDITLEKLATLATATSNEPALLFLKKASLRDKVAIKNVIADVFVNGEKNPKGDKASDVGTLFGQEGIKETTIASEDQTKIYDPKLKDSKVEVTEEQKNMKDRKENMDKHPDTSDHASKKDVVAEPDKVNKEFKNFVKKRTDKSASKKTAGVDEEDYIDYLNQVGVPEDDHPENEGRVPWGMVEFYGEWLQKEDPIAFNVGYNDYMLDHDEDVADAESVASKKTADVEETPEEEKQKFTCTV